jgi:hypothetical protein
VIPDLGQGLLIGLLGGAASGLLGIGGGLAITRFLPPASRCRST